MGKFAWFVLGLILGAAVALAAVTLTGRHAGAPPEEAAPAPIITRIPQVPPPETTLQPAPVPPAVVKPEAAAPAAEDKAQVAEDAAAAGMTSRSRREPPPPADAPAASDQ
jgi:hypothetical protein